MWFGRVVMRRLRLQTQKLFLLFSEAILAVHVINVKGMSGKGKLKRMTFGHDREGSGILAAEACIGHNIGYRLG